MAHNADVLRLLGNMDLDSDPTEIRDGYYRFAKNIVQTRDGIGTSRSTKATLGNRHIVNIGSVSQQNKRYRVYLPDNVDYDMLVELSHPNGGAAGLSWTFIQSPVGSNQSAINFKSQTDAFFGLNSQTYVTVLGNGYVDVEWGEYPLMDYTLTVSHQATGDDRYDHVVIREAISVDLAGKLIPIQSFDLDGDLFIWSTTQRNKPKEISAKVTNIGPVSGGFYIGPLTTVTFDIPHGLTQGQRIRITHSGHYWMNGLFVIASVPNANEIRIPTELVWPGVTAPLMPPGTTGNEKVFIHPEAIGEIGVITFDQNTDAYAYIRLMRSKELNLRTPWTLDRPTVKKNNYRTSIYWTDGSQSDNAPRAAYHLGEYGVDSMLGHTNAENGMYWLGRIDRATSLVPSQSAAYADFDSQLQDGGNLTAGNKRYAVRMLNRFLVGTDWSIPSDAIPVYGASNVAAPYNRAFGSESGSLTGKINILNIRDIDRYTFDFVEIAVIEYGSSVAADAKILKRIPTKSGPIGTVVTPTLQVRHDGYEQSTPLALSELIDLSSEMFDRAGNMSVLDSRMILSDLSKNADVDLTKWAKTFQHRIMVRELEVSDIFNVGEYQDVDNCVRYIGYMDNEKYRVGVRLRNRANGKWTKVFLVDDIQVDPYLTNGANTADNRRDQTGGPSSLGYLKQDFSLTNTPIPPTHVRISYFELFGADMNALIDGVPIRQNFDKIQFVRPNTIKSVIATGIGVMGVMIMNPLQIYPATDPSTSGSFVDLSGGFRRTKIVAYPNERQRIVEFPYFTHLHTALTPDLDPFVFQEYPLNQAVGQGFGRTNTRDQANVVWDPQLGGFNTPTNSKNPMMAFPNIISFYSPDIDFTNDDVSFIDGGRFNIRQIGFDTQCTRFNEQRITNWGRTEGFYAEFQPIHGLTSPNFIDFPIEKSSTVAYGGEADLDQFTIFSNGLFNASIGTPVQETIYLSGKYGRNLNAMNIANGQSWGTPGLPISNGLQLILDCWRGSQCTMIQVSDIPLNHPSTSASFGTAYSHGAFYAQIIKDIPDPYGDSSNTIYTNICQSFKINLFDSVVQKGDMSIFGGDTFAQSTYIKNRNINDETREGQAWGDWDAAFSGSQNNEGVKIDGRPGWGSFFKMFTQNRINTQMRFTDESQLVYIGDTINLPLIIDSTDAKRDLLTYSDTYTPALLTNTFAPYQNALPTRNESPARFAWSDPNIEDGLTDGYRRILPLNIKDLDLTDGKITWHYPINGELVSWQRNAFIRQLFNARGVLQASNDLNVVIGDGSVMSRPGIKLSSIGSTHRESIVVGKSDGGKDSVYWLNLTTFQVIRFGADGTVTISERQPVYSWLRDNAKWAIGEQSPYEMYGVRGIWDESYKEVIWTFTGKRKSPDWELSKSYAIGSIVTATDPSAENFHGLPASYRCILSHTSSAQTEPGTGTSWQSAWEIIPRTDNEHYTEFSIAWSEVKNGFTCFYTPMPRIYMPYVDSFATPHPTSPNDIYLHRKGDRLKWWELNGQHLEDVAYIEAVHNKASDQPKRYVAIQASSDTAPDRVEFETASQVSYLDDTEFSEFDGMFRSPIKDDSTQTGSNDAEDALRGRYLVVRVIFNVLSNNAVRNIVVKYFSRLRNAGK